MKLGLYWAKDDSGWDIVEVRKHNDNFVVYIMGWDCSSKVDTYQQFIKINLMTPDDKIYKTWDEIEYEKNFS
jgi:hypothetical protein